MRDELLAMPNPPPWTRAVLAIAWEKMGIMSEEQGDFATARDAYKESLAVARGMLAAAPTAEANSVVASSLSRLAYANLALGDAKAAAPLFEEATAIYDDQLARTPDDAEVSYSRAIASYKLGEVAESQANYTNALAKFQDAQTRTAALVAFDSTNLAWANLLGSCYSKISDQYESLKDPTNRLVAVRKYVEIADSISATDPHSDKYVQGAMFAHLRLASLYLDTNRPQDALAEYEPMLARNAARLAATHDVGIHKETGYILMMMGLVLHSTGHWPEAEQRFRTAITESEVAVASQPKNVDWQSELFLRRIELARSLYKHGRAKEAIELGRTAATELERATETEDPVVTVRENVSAAWELVAQWEGEQHAYGDGIRDMTHAQDVMAKLRAKNPTNTKLINDTATQWGTMAEILVAKGDRAGAKRVLTETVIHADPAVKLATIAALRKQLAACCP